MNRSIYCSKGDRRYLRANNIVHHLDVVEVSVSDYGKFIQVDRIIQIERKSWQKYTHSSFQTLSC